MIFVRLLLSLHVVAYVGANSMSGSFESCTLRCSQDRGYVPPSTSDQSAKLIRGKAGPKGEPGKTGRQGETGIKGAKGADGAVGERGATGEMCDKEEFEAFKINVQKLEDRLQKLSLGLSVTDCSSAKTFYESATSGVFTIYPIETSSPVRVFCDFEDDGLAWMVFQRRYDGSTNFNRTFAVYEAGFGKATGEFWAGLRLLSQLTEHGVWELKVDLEDYDGNYGYAKYGVFKIGEAPFYKLTVASYSGTAGDSLTSRHNGRSFTTLDRDLDAKPDHNCAQQYSGAWWYSACHHSNLNAFNYDLRSGSSSMSWYHFHNNRVSFKRTTMKMRKIS